MVNGPKDGASEWDAIDWRDHEDTVRRLRQRIFTATREQDLAKVRNLQKLMLRSWSNTLLSVRQATQRNAGRKTAGVDGQVVLTSQARMDLAVQVHRERSSWQPRPVKRAYIPKAGNRAKLRPLYGFRPGRGCHDAISAIFTVCRGSQAKRAWALDADLAAAFDKIDHARLLETLGSFPAKDMIRAWLKAGVFEKGKGFAPTEEGTPQGGLCAAAHNPPNEQRWVMRSVCRLPLVGRSWRTNAAHNAARG